MNLIAETKKWKFLGKPLTGSDGEVCQGKGLCGHLGEQVTYFATSVFEMSGIAGNKTEPAGVENRWPWAIQAVAQVIYHLQHSFSILDLNWLAFPSLFLLSFSYEPFERNSALASCMDMWARARVCMICVYVFAYGEESNISW